MQERSTLVKSADGIYRPLDKQIEDRMRPAPPPRDRYHWLKSAGFFVLTLLVGLGVLIGMLVVCGFAACFWIIRKIRDTAR